MSDQPITSAEESLLFIKWLCDRAIENLHNEAEGAFTQNIANIAGQALQLKNLVEGW